MDSKWCSYESGGTYQVFVLRRALHGGHVEESVKDKGLRRAATDIET